MLPCQYAYHAAKCLCDKPLECLWVEVGLRELEQLIEIRILAYLRVAKNQHVFRDKTDMQCLFPN